MPGIQAFPYLRPLPDQINITEWLQLAGGSSEPLSVLLPHWDPGMSPSIRVLLQVDIRGIWSQCQLSVDDTLRLVLLWNSRGTGLRGRGDFVDLCLDYSGEPPSLDLTVDGTLLAETVRFELQLVLAKPGRSQSQLAPRLPGSILWREERLITLEGQGTRFPTELVSFSDTQWLPADAGWFLDWDPDALDERTLGSVRLFLNKDNSFIRNAVVPGSTIEDKLLRNMILFDIGRTMIISALCNDDFIQNAGAYEEGSVGAAIRHLLHAHFPTESIDGLAQRCQNSPTRFECELQARLGLFREV